MMQNMGSMMTGMEIVSLLIVLVLVLGIVALVTYIIRL
jgi:hypothetical protein